MQEDEKRLKDAASILHAGSLQKGCRVVTLTLLGLFASKLPRAIFAETTESCLRWGLHF